MTDYYIKVPNDKTDFFNELMENLGFEYEQFQSAGEDGSNELDNDSEFFYVDSED